MKFHHIELFILLIICFNLNNCECLNSRYKRSKDELKTTMVMAPALMLATSDTISLIYPKELGYEKDFLHVIYKLNNDGNDSLLRIEDSVYDNHTWSIYCIVSNSSGGTELIRLRHLVPFNKRESLRNRKQIDSNEKIITQSGYQIASNWSRTVIFKNTTTKLLSLDINVKKRKLYWFEFDTLNKKWSLVISKLNNILDTVSYFTFNGYMFSNDGYSYISIAHDYENKKKHSKNDIVLFVSNNQTLNICFLINMTCEDYFRTPSPVKTTKIQSIEASSNDEDYDESDEDDEGLYHDKSHSIDSDKIFKEVNITQIESVIEQPPLYKFGQLTGIIYEKNEHALYLSDYGNDRIEKITFDKDVNVRNDYKFLNIETIFKSDQSPINPIMSIFYDSYIFWIDFEEGLKTTVFKSTCVRTIYKVKESTSLKFIQIGTFKALTTSKAMALDQTDSNSNINRLVSIQDSVNAFQYPPDYYIYNSNEEFISDKRAKLKIGLKSLSSNVHSNSRMNITILIFLFVYIIRNILYT